jgi:hypothetical protein
VASPRLWVGPEGRCWIGDGGRTDEAGGETVWHGDEEEGERMARKKTTGSRARPNAGHTL